jgi:hypothetical protein
MKLEIATLENIDALSMVDRYDSDGAPHHVLSSTWAFKCKQYPDGWIKKFKAVSVQEAINNSKGLTSSRPLPQLSNGPPYG